MPRKGKSRKAPKPKPPLRSTQSVSYIITALLVVLNIIIPLLYVSGAISQTTMLALSSIALSLLFPSAVFSYMLFRGKNLKTIVSELGLSRDKFTLKNLLIGIVVWLTILAVAVSIGLFSYATKIPLPTNVQQLFSGTPSYFLIFSFLIAPIDEEIFFRGFLIKRPKLGLILLGLMFFVFAAAAISGAFSVIYILVLGLALLALIILQSKYPNIIWSSIIISAIIFSLFHLSYVSISEFVAALSFGLIAGYAFKKTESLYPSILAHMLVNTITIVSLFYLVAFIHI